MIGSKEEEADGMRASQQFIKQLEELFQTYEKEVKGIIDWKPKRKNE
jgi:hypothetical protein